VAIVFGRAGKPFKATVTLAAVPKVSGAEMAWSKLGVKLQTLTPEIAAELGVTAGQGMVVVDVDRSGPAYEAGVRRGLVIARVSGADIRGESELAAALAEVNTGDPVTLTVYTSVRRGMFLMQNADNVRVTAR
jgi:S1-C subfamily serine protease